MSRPGVRAPSSPPIPCFLTRLDLPRSHNISAFTHRHQHPSFTLKYPFDPSFDHNRRHFLLRTPSHHLLTTPSLLAHLPAILLICLIAWRRPCGQSIRVLACFVPT